MHPKIQFQLFGPFQIVVDGKPVEKVQQSTQQQLLLAYCLLHRNEVLSRSRIASALWPDTIERQARTNLRQLIHHLRRSFPLIHNFVDIQPQTLRWQANSTVECDLFRFEDACIRADSAPDGQTKLDALNEATSLYVNPLLADCYAEWLLHPREMLYQQYLLALTQLATLQQNQRAYSGAIRTVQTLLHNDPLRESAYCLLMDLHVTNGDRAAAMRAFHECVSLLRSELGVEPSAQTIALYDRLLLNDDVSDSINANGINGRNLHQSHVQPQFDDGVNSQHNSQHNKHSNHHNRRHNSHHVVPLAQSQALIGREKEWNQLQAAWQRAANGSARVFLIAGEAGMGKSRLAEELLVYAMRHGIAAASTRSYASAGDLAYGPVAQWLRSDPLKHQWRDLDDPWLTEIAHIVPELLVEQPTLAPPEPLQERWQRKRLFEALAQAFNVHEQPLLLVLDDLQWCDSDTLEFIHFLLSFAPTKSLLIVGTLRPEEIDSAHPATELMLALRQDGLIDDVELTPLNEDETAALAAQTAMDELTHAEQEEIYSLAGGNPLYVVETVRSQSYLGDDLEELTVQRLTVEPSQAKIPPRVYATIQRRLRGLSPVARELAAVAAVIGRAFSFNHLAAVSEYTEDAVVRSLDELWQRRIMRERGVHEYDFSHDRIRDVAYAEVGPAERRSLHGRVAEMLDAQVNLADDSIAPLHLHFALAEHYRKAGVWDKAVDHLQLAAKKAQSLHAYKDAANCFELALDTVAKGDDTPHNQKLTLSLLIDLASTKAVSLGDSSIAVGRLYNQVRTLSLLYSSDEYYLRSLNGIRRHYGVRGEWHKAIEVSQQAIEVVKKNPVHRWASAAYHLFGCTLFHRGEFELANFYQLKAMKIGISTNIDHYPQLGICCQLARGYWHLGYAIRAEEYNSQSIDIARSHNRPMSMIFALQYASILQICIGNNSKFLGYARELYQIVEKYEFSDYKEVAMILWGWGSFLCGERELSIEYVESAGRLIRDGTFGFMRPFYLYLCADIQIKIGNVKNADDSLQHALRVAELSGDHCWLSELHRLWGDLKLAKGDNTDSIYDSYHLAIDIARKQSAKSLELRATMSLARLWQEEDKRADAHALLAEIYNWFTEGFETKDLIDAKALLDELA